MPINAVEVLSLVTQLCEEENLRVSIKESVKGGFTTGIAATIGGLLGGPIGLPIGATVGGVAAWWMAKGKFKSVAEVIRDDLTPAQRERLVNSVMRIINNFGPADMLALTVFTLQPALKDRVLQEVFHFFQSQLQMEILD